MSGTSGNVTKLEAAFARAAQPREIRLRLFIAGMTPRSTRAVIAMKRLCEKLGSRCSMEIVDIYEQPAAAAAAQVVAIPTLVRERPLPRRKLIGALDDVEDIAQRAGIALQGGYT